MIEYISLVLHDTIALITILNPIAAASIMISMLDSDTSSIKSTAFKATATVFVASLVTLFGGEFIFKLFGINVHSLKVIGGVILMLIAINMAYGQASKARHTKEEQDEAEEKEDVSVIPIGIPILFGPGVIATIIVLNSNHVKEFSTITTKDGTFNMWMIKPTNFDTNKKYPVLMYQYSGPGVQTVQNSWNGYNDYWYYMLAEKGYIIVSVDGRGTGGKGAAFTKITYKELGKYETIDQIEAAKELGKRSYIDAERIGIWGWSFGGYTSSNALLKGNEVFKMAIAVAPVTNWRYYDTVYTERYMQTPQENPTGYDDNSPLFFANRLKGKYLLVHGTGDDNVHVQNSMQMINALIKADVPFDSELYPDRTHGIYRGENTRLHLYKKMTNFLLENL